VCADILTNGMADNKVHVQGIFFKVYEVKDRMHLARLYVLYLIYNKFGHILLFPPPKKNLSDFRNKI